MSKAGQISPSEAHKLLEQGEAGELVDVRQPVEYRLAHVESSRLIPLGELPARIGEIEAGTTLLTLCRSGSRSAMDAQQLTLLGFKVRNIQGGLMAWIAAGLPVTGGE